MPPKSKQTLRIHRVNENQAFSYQLPADAFIDLDNDALSYTATLSDGSALPSWLSFDAATQTFSGTPSYDDANVLTVKVTATDPAGLFAEQVFSLDVIDVPQNHAPEVKTDIADTSVNENQAFSYQLPADAFIDLDNDTLSYTATLADGSALPSWLSFDAATQTFSGTPSYDDANVLTVKVVASDGQATASQTFTVTIQDVPNNTPPVLISTPAILSNSTEDTVYTIKASDLLQGYSDAENDTLSVINLQANHGVLVSHQNGTYSFTPDANFNGTVNLSYQVSDGKGGVVNAANSFVVSSVNDDPVISVEPIIRQLPEDSRLELDVLAGITDADNDVLTLTDVSLDTGGQVFISSEQKIVFIPTVNFTGQVNLSYTVKDAQGATVTGTAKINVTPVNDAPVLRVTKPNNTSRLIEDAAAVLVGLAFGLQIEDVDAQPLASLTIALQQGTAQDVLSVTTQGTNLQANYDANTGVMTILGLGSLAQYQQVLDSLALSTRAEQGASQRGLHITINDGQFSDSVTITLPVDYVQDEFHQGGDGNDTLYGGDGDDTLRGGDGDDILHGGNGNDVLFGDAGNDILNGGDGQDTMHGGAGDDIFIVDDVGDVITDSSGDDQVQTTISFKLPDGFEKLQFSGLQSGLLGQGNSGNNTLQNNDGGGELQGGAGNDTLEGGAGRDVLLGGEGADTFGFSYSENGVLRLGEVLDFSAARGDKIDVSKIDANFNVADNQNFDFIGGQAFSNTAGELRFSQRLLQGDINGDGQADFEIKLVGVLELKQDDILL